jgi:hypothetical protein
VHDFPFGSDKILGLLSFLALFLLYESLIDVKVRRLLVFVVKYAEKLLLVIQFISLLIRIAVSFIRKIP